MTNHRTFLKAALAIVALCFSLPVLAGAASAWTGPTVKITGQACGEGLKAGTEATVTVTNEDDRTGVLTNLSGLSFTPNVVPGHGVATAHKALPSGTGSFTVDVTITWYDEDHEAVDQREATRTVHFAECVQPTSTTSTTVASTSTTTSTVPATTTSTTTVPSATSSAPSTTEPSTTASVVTTASVSSVSVERCAAGETVVDGACSLPVTGSPLTGPLVAIGVALIACGALMVRRARANQHAV